jgi:hypothetical protein
MVARGEECYAQCSSTVVVAAATAGLTSLPFGLLLLPLQPPAATDGVAGNLLPKASLQHSVSPHYCPPSAAAAVVDGAADGGPSWGCSPAMRQFSLVIRLEAQVEKRR